MIKKIGFIAVLFILFGCTVFSQENISLPFLQINPDTRTSGMGDASMGEAKSMYLYTNPTSIFQGDKKIYGSCTFGLYPSIDDSRSLFGAVSTGYKFLDRHAVMVGFRYFNGLETSLFDQNGNRTKNITPFDWSIDFAYAFNFSPALSAYIGGNFIQSYNYKTAYTGGMSVGAYYRNKLNISKNEAAYTVGASLNNLGSKFKYGKRGIENDMPTSINLGGSILYPFNDSHKVNLAASTHYFLLPSDAKLAVFNIGAEYEMFNMGFLRAGYHIQKDNNGYATLGLGFKFKFINVDASYLMAQDKDFNLMRLGLQVEF